MPRLHEPLVRLTIAALLLAAPAAHAAHHALIIWIGTYANPKNNLKGIDLDARRAEEMALRMGVPGVNIRQIKNEQVTRDGLSAALKALTVRIAKDDRVFIYYSGHGTQGANVSRRPGCSEGLATYEGYTYYDVDLRNDLDLLADKASQVVMFNDSCFSGGAATKALQTSPAADEVPKFYADAGKAGSASDPGYVCGRAVNELSKSLGSVGQTRSSQVFYLAAAADNEVSISTPQGGYATQAWSACLADPTTDTDGSGLITGDELVACSKKWIDQHAKGRQTITGLFNGRLPISPARPTTGVGQQPAAAINPEAALRNIASAGDPSYRVKLTPANRTLRVGQDLLQFSVESNKAGYLYVFQVGSDRKTFNLIYPNKANAENAIGAGELRRFPTGGWSVRAAGPAGATHLMAYVSPVRRDFRKDLDPAAFFALRKADAQGLTVLFDQATGGAAGSAVRYGASAVETLREVP